MKKFILQIFCIFALFCSVSAQERIKLTYVEFVIPLSQNKKTTFEALSKFEGVASFNAQNFQTLFEEATKKKLIKVIARDSRVLDIGKTEILARQPDINMMDKNGNLVDKRPGLIFAVTPWILGEDNKPYVGFDLVFQRNEIDKTIPVQSHFAWWGINFSNPNDRAAFDEVRQFGYRDKVKNQFNALAFFFERER